MEAVANALVVGGDSLIGQSLVQHLKTLGWSTLSTSRRGGGDIHLDLGAAPGSWPTTADIDVVFLCAAITSTQECETDPQRARTINVTNMVRVAEHFARKTTHVVFLSSNLVFDGTVPFPRPETPVRPNSVYGSLKAEAENRLQKALPHLAIVRLTKVIGPQTTLFRQWLTKLRRDEAIIAFSDMVFAPISAAFAADALCRLAETRTAGIFHLSADADISYEAAARHLATSIGVPAKLVLSGSRRSAEIADAFAPRFTCLECESTATLLKLAPPAPLVAFDAIVADHLANEQTSAPHWRTDD